MALFTLNTPHFTHSKVSTRYPLAIGALALITFLSGCSKPETQAPPGAAGGTMPVMPVTAINVQPEKVPTLIEAVGQAEGSKDVDVRPRVPGVLMQQRYKEGDYVKAGTLLFTIDRAPFQIALNQAQAALAQDKANLERSEREATRLKPLVAEKAISSRELDDANTTLQAALASQKVNEARLRDAELNLSYTHVTAPIDGVTGRAQLSLGSLVTAGAQSSLLTTINTSNPIWVRFAFSESEAAQLRRVGKPEIHLILDDGSRYAPAGVINFSASTVNNRTGMVEMRAEFANPEHRLLPGQFMRVQVNVGDRDGYLIPHAAVAQTEQGSVLFTVTPDNTIAPRPIVTAGWSEQNWVVTEGLAPGDRVIIDNLMKMRPGAPVAPHAPGEAPAGPKQ